MGQEKAKLALLCCAVNPTIGGVLLSGDKGTGKSTLVRALADVLPEVEVIADCPFNCSPRSRFEMCDSCYSRLLNGEELRVARRKMRVVDLPLSITVDRLVGTLDIRRALTEGVRALQPGLLAEANGNILYIDEVNLLDDYVADVLLDSAAMGWNIVEREGISVKHPAKFILVGSMNPEEGELRPQISDRFGLYVDVEASSDPEQRVEIIERVEEFQRDPDSFYRRYEAEQDRIREAVARAREFVWEVEVDRDLLKLLADTVVKMGIRTHRAEIVTVKAAKAIAALDGRRKVRLEDLERAMELALPHRLRHRPFEQQRPQAPKLGDARREANGGGSNAGGGGGASGGQGGSRPNAANAPQRMFEPEEAEAAIGSARARAQASSGPAGRGSRARRATVIGAPHGHPISYAPPRSPLQLSDLDLAATICAAAYRLEGPPIRVREGDFRVRVRKARVPRLTAILLDSSGSMGAMRRMAIAKGVALSLVKDSYVKRDYAALIAFRGLGAEVAVQPTRKYERLLDAVGSLPTGGRTPLPSALAELLAMAKRFKMKNRRAAVRGILITDGKANASLWGRPIREELEILSRALRRAGVEFEIYDARPPASFDPSPSYIECLAEALGAKVYRV